ncbi:hypothetical protein U1Q18_002497, partial [Sarracenia purpurea var. burkii]
LHLPKVAGAACDSSDAAREMKVETTGKVKDKSCKTSEDCRSFCKPGCQFIGCVLGKCACGCA